jgi:hypothetical protein
MTIGRIPSVEGGIQPTIFDAKADILTATAADTPARLAVGSNGDTLVADSAATTGLRWQANFAAGKNKIINGDFNINQRGFTSNTSSQTYNFDRFWQSNSGGTATVTPQTFTTGTAPVSGYEGKNYVQIVTASQSASSDHCHYTQTIESVRTFAGQTVTFSFWAKAASGTPKIALELYQYFGSGGSPSAAVSTAAGTATLSTSWARYSITVNVPSISGKTIGTANNDGLLVNMWVSSGSDYNARSSSIGIQNNTFSIWGVQLEAGSVATAFQTATGTIQGELAACQRYYETITGITYAGAAGYSYTYGQFIVYKATKRSTPTITVTRTGQNNFNNTAQASDISIDGFVAKITSSNASNVEGYWIMNATISSEL